MNVQEYIDSGVLYDYCTDALSAPQRAEVEKMCAWFTEVRKELSMLQSALGQQKSMPAPSSDLQETIWNTLDNINKEKSCDISRLPVINKYSDYNNWKKMVQSFMPQTFSKDREVATIRNSGGVTQMLIHSRTDVEEEVHEHERESFLVLEGECECHIGSEIYRIGPGGFIEIPLHTPHNVRILSPYVVAVLQLVAL